MKISSYFIRTCLLASILASQVYAVKTGEEAESAATSSTAHQTFNAEKYSVARGEKVRLHQQMLERKYGSVVGRAFEKASALNGMSPLGWKVVDFGCGLGLTRGTIQKIIGDAGLYTGVDIHEGDIQVARSDSPGVLFVVGDQTTPKVQEVLGQADAVFMRHVTMHQQSGTHETFLGDIFKHLKPGGILIDLEHAGTPEQEALLIGKWPLLKELFDLKRQRELDDNANYDIALQEKALLGKLTDIPIMEISEDNVMNSQQFTSFLEGLIRVDIELGRVVQSETDATIKKLIELAKTPNFYFHTGNTFVFIAKKPVLVSPPAQ